MIHAVCQKNKHQNYSRYEAEGSSIDASPVWVEKEHQRADGDKASVVFSRPALNVFYLLGEAKVLALRAPTRKRTAFGRFSARNGDGLFALGAMVAVPSMMTGCA
jgi:hypothetical protein